MVKHGFLLKTVNNGLKSNDPVPHVLHADIAVQSSCTRVKLIPLLHVWFLSALAVNCPVGCSSTHTQRKTDEW